MIKKAQISFIATTMSILFVVFGVIYALSYNIMKNITELSIEKILTEAKDSFLVHGKEVVFHNGMVAYVSHNHNTNSYNYNYVFDSSIFTEESVEKIINAVFSRPYYSGKFSNVYYRVTALDKSETQFVLVAGDMSDSIGIFNSQLLNAFFILLTIFLILFYIVFRLSFRVFQPIRESFLKQKQFISNASHELKTPLAVISANADVLKHTDDNLWVSNIKSQTERMNVLVADMLTLAKMDEGSLVVKNIEFNLSDEILNATLPFDAVAFEKGKSLDIDVDSDIIINGDAESVRNVVSILMDNAIKHASEKGSIKVSLKKESSRVALTVFNTGSLVPALDSNKIFERFYRADTSRNRESGGSGLGLSIARGICEANKWKISAESIYQESMTITVVFK